MVCYMFNSLENGLFQKRGCLMYEYTLPFFAIAFGVLAMALMLIACWTANRDAKLRFVCAALFCAIVCGFGWSHDTDKLVQEVQQYQTAYAGIVHNALTTPPSKDGGQSLFQRLIINMPKDFPDSAIACDNNAAIKAAIDPLVAGGQVRAGVQPAWDKLINCAITTGAPTAAPTPVR